MQLRIDLREQFDVRIGDGQRDPHHAHSIKPILKWDSLAPKSKITELHQYGNYKRHPRIGH